MKRKKILGNQSDSDESDSDYDVEHVKLIGLKSSNIWQYIYKNSCIRTQIRL